MANNYVLDIKDTSSVNEWKERAQKLNERSQQAVQEAADALNEFRNTAEGNVFEDVCKYSDGVVTGMTKVMAGMNEILTTVNRMMAMVKAKSQELSEGVSGLSNSVLG